MQNKKNVMSINSSNYCTSCGQIMFDKVIKNKSNKKFIISEPSERHGNELLILTPRTKKKRSKSVDLNKSKELDSSSRSGETKNLFTSSSKSIIKSKSSIDTSCDHSRSSRSKSRRESLDVLKDTNKSFEKNQIRFIRNMDLNDDELKLINDRIYNVLNNPMVNNNLLKILSFIPNSFIFYSNTNKLYKIIEDKDGLKDYFYHHFKNYKITNQKSISIDQLALELSHINTEIYCNIFKQIKYIIDPPLELYVLISKEIIKIKLPGEGFFDKNKVSILTLYTIYIDWFQSKSKMYIK